MTRVQAIEKTRKLCKTFIIIGVIMLSIGFYKNTFYNNPNGDDWSYNDDETPVNVYVGGDAYNYIINGTRFTAYAVMGTGSLIIASIMGGINICLSIKSDEEIDATEKLPEI